MAEERDIRPVFFFDIDNCLYPKSKKVFAMMQDLIDDYFVRHLSLSREDAVKLHRNYYTQYGLAIEGLVRHHQIDPLDYNRQVDDALPLETVLSPDAQLRQLLQDFDKSKVRLWLLTNAYITHAKRVVKLLGVDDLFEGLTFCEYDAEKIICKPYKEMYEKAQKEAGVSSPEDCYFVDDSWMNCKAAQDLGWTTAHLLEPDQRKPKTPASKYQIRDLEELRDIFPQFFRQTTRTADIR